MAQWQGVARVVYLGGLYLKAGLAAVLVSVGVMFICNDLVVKSPSEFRCRSSQ